MQDSKQEMHYASGIDESWGLYPSDINHQSQSTSVSQVLVLQHPMEPSHPTHLCPRLLDLQSFHYRPSLSDPVELLQTLHFCRPPTSLDPHHLVPCCTPVRSPPPSGVALAEAPELWGSRSHGAGLRRPCPRRHACSRSSDRAYRRIRFPRRCPFEGWGAKRRVGAFRRGMVGCAMVRLAVVG